MGSGIMVIDKYIEPYPADGKCYRCKRRGIYTKLFIGGLGIPVRKVYDLNGSEHRCSMFISMPEILSGPKYGEDNWKHKRKVTETSELNHKTPQNANSHVKVVESTEKTR